MAARRALHAFATCGITTFFADADQVGHDETKKISVYGSHPAGAIKNPAGCRLCEKTEEVPV